MVCVGPGRKPRRPVFSRRGSDTNEEVISHTTVSITKTLIVLRHEKTMRFPNRSATNWSNQSQKMDRTLKFWISEKEELYYPCSENKGTDQLCSYYEADLYLCFRICSNSVGFPITRLFLPCDMEPVKITVIFTNFIIFFFTLYQLNSLDHMETGPWLKVLSDGLKRPRNKLATNGTSSR